MLSLSLSLGSRNRSLHQQSGLLRLHEILTMLFPSVPGTPRCIKNLGSCDSSQSSLCCPSRFQEPLAASGIWAPATPRNAHHAISLGSGNPSLHQETVPLALFSTLNMLSSVVSRFFERLTMLCLSVPGTLAASGIWAPATPRNAHQVVSLGSRNPSLHQESGLLRRPAMLTMLCLSVPGTPHCVKNLGLCNSSQSSSCCLSRFQDPLPLHDESGLLRPLERFTMLSLSRFQEALAASGIWAPAIP